MLGWVEQRVEILDRRSAQRRAASSLAVLDHVFTCFTSPGEPDDCGLHSLSRRTPAVIWAAMGWNHRMFRIANSVKPKEAPSRTERHLRNDEAASARMRP